MNTGTAFLAYERLAYHLKHPALDVCWMDAYQLAKEGVLEADNPYREGSKEYQYWQDGWHAGFFDEAPLFDYKPSSEFMPYSASVLDYGVFKEAVNDSKWFSDSIRKWAGRVVKIAGAIAVTVAAIELIDLAV